MIIGVMVMNKIGKVLSLLLIAIIIIFCGCCADVSANADSWKNEKEEKTYGMFIEVERYITYHVAYHKETKVLYIVGGNGHFELLVNPDGTPMMWDGDG